VNFLKIKLLEFSGENYLIVIIRGIVGPWRLGQIFRKLAEAIPPLADCRVFIDLADASFRLEPPDIDDFVNSLTPDLLRLISKIALVSAPEFDELGRLGVLSAHLCSLGLKTAVFDQAKSALAWLGE
jgi:hypothetical protein